MSSSAETNCPPVSSDLQNEKKPFQKCLGDTNPDTLSLKSQGLSKLPTNISISNSLVKVILEENIFCNLPSEICSLQSLKYLNVSKNKIRVLPDEIGNLINLEYLDVSENHLENLPCSLSLATELWIFNASKNNLSELPDDYKRLKKLGKVNLSFNKLTEVPLALTFGSNTIAELDLSHNNLRDFSKEPRCSGSLKILNIYSNRIEEFPHWIKCLPVIEELYLGNNPFTAESRNLIDNIVPLNAITIKKLSVTSCGLTHLPTCLKDMKNVMYLEAGNDYTSVNSCVLPNTIWDADSLLSLYSLRELRLYSVSLPVLPDNIWQILKCLEVLDLRDNNLTWLPEGISNLPHLILCMLSNNRLALLPSDIGNLRSLKELRVDGNKLSELPESFSKLENLVYLDLYDNELFELPPKIFQLCNLKYLDMEINHFSTIHSSSKENKLSEESYASYTAMKDRLRSVHFLKNNRVDGVKEIPCGVSDVDSEVQKSRSPSPDKYEYHPDIQDSLYNCSIGDDDDEDWDKSDGSDNFFDPSYSQALKDSAARSQWHWARDNGRWEPPSSADVFCPADIHPDLMPRPSNKNESKVNDGQFDDADDLAD